MGKFLHACEGELICESVNPKVPFFNAPIYLENKTSIGKVDEILGPINQVYFTIKPQEGIQATSFKTGDKFYIGGDKLLPLEKFLPKPKAPPGMNLSLQETMHPTHTYSGTRVKRPVGARGAFSGARGGRGAPRGRGSFGAGGRGAPRGRGSFGSFGGGRGAPRGGARGFSGGRGGSRGAPRGRGRF
ncbi:uncharacterized protein A1O9_00020 [Exophiala aquamarina CBS 119918]|uniref:H/ACA ribonucleoprotein complex subunit n=1 Tax=Exophiala aquamarina CBS 119918 TaxID=1182545 RepID=A0A072PRS9_9EURO|nr:uncharacterized protein A1O9_00020 [Exophiala aquamarina CBS 119918]KEF62048.1 hypothetical protein A1O9_00020 [Exophiala aquamarina CBS 119918]